MSREFRLGVFIVGTLTILAMGIFMIGGKQFLFSPTYKLQSTFKTVAGLNEGAEVRVGGIHKGTVRQIRLPAQSAGGMTVIMDMDRSTRRVIKRDSVASIQTEGLLGNKFVEISFGSDRAAPVESGDAIEGAPPHDISDLMQKANEILDNTNESTQNLAQISSKINEGKGTIGALVNNKRVYQQLDAATTQAEAGAAAFQEDMQALKRNWFLRGFFSRRGYYDSTEVAKHEIGSLPKGQPRKQFAYGAQEIFDKPESAKLKNEKLLNEAGRFLEGNPFGLAVVVVYNGMKGDAEQARLLTQARAMVVRDYIVKNFRMDDTRFKTMGLGKNGPHDVGEVGRIVINIY